MVVLIAEDDPDVRRSVRRVVERYGDVRGLKLEVETAADVPEALEKIAERRFSLVITDMSMPGGTGFDVIDACRKRGTAVVILSANSDVPTIVKSVKLGALNYIVKDGGFAEVTTVLDSELLERSSQRGVAAAPSLPGVLPLGESSRAGSTTVVGSDDAFRAVLARVERLIDTSATVFITGESGTGKEVIARLIHEAGARRSKPFVTVICGAIPEGTFESELFGHIKGAYTDAITDREGAFAAAEGGTLFLDEVSEMPLAMQVKLLHAIQSKEYRVLGKTRWSSSDVRFVAAANRDMKQLIAQGKFRDDLYFRLNVIPLHLPPLRQRPRDIQSLISHFLSLANAEHRRHVRGMSAAALAVMESYPWPGNVRELEHCITQMVVMKPEGGELDLADLPDEIRAPAPLPDLGERLIRQPVRRPAPEFPLEGIVLGDVLTRIKMELVTEALKRSDNNRQKAAKLLGINRTTLVETLKRMKIAQGDGADEADED